MFYTYICDLLFPLTLLYDLSLSIHAALVHSFLLLILSYAKTTHSFYSQAFSLGSSEGTAAQGGARDIEGETLWCGFRARDGGKAAIVLVLSLLPV